MSWTWPAGGNQGEKGQMSRPPLTPNLTILFVITGFLTSYSRAVQKNKN